MHKLVLHKGKIQDLAFSPGEKYLATLGGRDDNKLVIWDVATGEAICGAAAASETTNTVRFFNRMLLTHALPHILHRSMHDVCIVCVINR